MRDSREETIFMKERGHPKCPRTENIMEPDAAEMEKLRGGNSVFARDTGEEVQSSM